jgi:xanthine dehydrogenase accessory factor
MSTLILIRGGGDLASGVAYRLHKGGLRVLITELARPLHVRRTVSFADAVYTGETEVEGVTARCAADIDAVTAILDAGQIAVLVDPSADALAALRPLVLVDARMRKQAPETGLDAAPLVVGLGPGFMAGETCHAVIETMRGHDLGRVIWQGGPQPDSGVPGSVATYNRDRVLRAPAGGQVRPHFAIGDRVKAGRTIAEVARQLVAAPFDGVLRGLVHPDLQVSEGMKIGDLDPRNDPAFIHRISDKSLAIGGGVLETVLTRPEIRTQLWA